MTRAELQILSQAHAVALSAMVAGETGRVPLGAADALVEAAGAEMPAFAPACSAFRAGLRAAHGDLRLVKSSAAQFRDAVCQAMAFRPVDAGRVDIHG